MSQVFLSTLGILMNGSLLGLQQSHTRSLNKPIPKHQQIGILDPKNMDHQCPRKRPQLNRIMAPEIDRKSRSRAKARQNQRQ